MIGGLYRFVRNPCTSRSARRSSGRPSCCCGRSCWATPRCSSSSSPRSCIGTRSRRSSAGTARSTRATGAPSPAGFLGGRRGRRWTVELACGETARSAHGAQDGSGSSLGSEDVAGGALAVSSRRSSSRTLRESSAPTLHTTPIAAAQSSVSRTPIQSASGPATAKATGAIRMDPVHATESTRPSTSSGAADLERGERRRHRDDGLADSRRCPPQPEQTEFALAQDAEARRQVAESRDARE